MFGKIGRFAYGLEKRILGAKFLDTHIMIFSKISASISLPSEEIIIISISIYFSFYGFCLPWQPVKISSGQQNCMI